MKKLSKVEKKKLSINAPNYSNKKKMRKSCDVCFMPNQRP